MFRMLPQWTWSANIWACACGLQMSGEARAVCTKRGDVSSLTCHVVGIRVHRLSLWYLISAGKWQICMEISNFSMDPKSLIPPSSSDWNTLMLCITSCETIPGNRTHSPAVKPSQGTGLTHQLWNHPREQDSLTSCETIPGNRTHSPAVKPSQGTGLTHQLWNHPREQDSLTSCETIPGNRTHLAAVRRASSASRRLACNDFLWNSNCMACLRHCFSSWSLRRMSSFSSPRPCVLSIVWLMSKFDRLWKHQNNPVCTKGSDKRVWLQIML